ncbi:hypothetical protein QG37_06014 [Candidozyma auris]|nr:hypothetical protein QG37_06014 [[Candida] auris]
MTSADQLIRVVSLFPKNDNTHSMALENDLDIISEAVEHSLHVSKHNKRVFAQLTG